LSDSAARFGRKKNTPVSQLGSPRPVFPSLAPKKAQFPTHRKRASALQPVRSRSQRPPGSGVFIDMSLWPIATVTRPSRRSAGPETTPGARSGRAVDALEIDMMRREGGGGSKVRLQVRPPRRLGHSCPATGSSGGRPADARPSRASSRGATGQSPIARASRMRGNAVSAVRNALSLKPGKH
jgi:hypothetical protein